MYLDFKCIAVKMENLHITDARDMSIFIQSETKSNPTTSELPQT